MTRSEADVQCASLNADEDPGHRWLAHQMSPGEWVVIKVSGAGSRIREPLKASIESRSKPSDPPDPRPAIFQNVPPYGAA